MCSSNSRQQSQLEYPGVIYHGWRWEQAKGTHNTKRMPGDKAVCLEFSSVWVATDFLGSSTADAVQLTIQYTLATFS